MADSVIYHNPKCGTSRNTLALMREAGIEPEVVEYLKTPPSKDRLRELARLMGVPVSELLRTKESLYDELGLADPSVSEEALLDAMQAHPILINRPIVVTPLGARLCRPAESVASLLPRK